MNNNDKTTVMKQAFENSKVVKLGQIEEKLLYCTVNKERLISIRKIKFMNARKLAFFSGVNVRDIQKIENGITNTPKISTIQKLANALEVPVSELITSETKKIRRWRRKPEPDTLIMPERKSLPLEHPASVALQKKFRKTFRNTKSRKKIPYKSKLMDLYKAGVSVPRLQELTGIDDAVIYNIISGKTKAVQRINRERLIKYFGNSSNKTIRTQTAKTTKTSNLYVYGGIGVALAAFLLVLSLIRSGL